MGLFDFLNKGKKGVNTGETNENTGKANASPLMEIRLTDGSYIELYSIIDKATIRHGDGRNTIVKVAAISQNLIPGQASVLGPSKFIAFEVQEGQVIDESCIYSMINKYLIQKTTERSTNGMQSNTLKQKCISYIGEYSPDIKDFTKRSKVSEQYVLEKIFPEYEQKMNSQYSHTNGDIKSGVQLNAGIVRNIEERERIRQERLNNPYFKMLKSSKVNGQELCNYNGINIRTGDILKIRQLQKVGKDGSETYLYAGYAQNVSSESSVEKLSGEPLGAYICFETKKRIEDIASEQNLQDVNSLLELLSLDNYQNNGSLNYIGSIDEYGRISRTAMPNSSAIRNQVIKMQKNYADRKRNEGWEI